MVCRRFVVSGRVQGVFYRASTQQAALRFDLTGWVRNLADGSVELVACGDDAKLDQLEQWLWQGSPKAQVEQVVASEVEAKSFSNFDIIK